MDTREEQNENKDEVLGRAFSQDIATLIESYFNKGLPLNVAAKILMGGAFDCHETYIGARTLRMFEEFGKKCDERYSPRS